MKSLFKPLVLIILIGLMAIPVSMIYDIINDRKNNRNYAKNSIAQSWTNAQTIKGPWLVVAYEQTQTVITTDDKTKETRVNKYQQAKKAFYRPTELAINSTLDVGYRYRNIFKVATYKTALDLTALFELDELTALLKQDETTRITAAWLDFGVTDSRGFTEKPVIKINGVARAGKPNNSGFTVMISDMFDLTSKQIAVASSFVLNGIESISFTPCALENDIKISSAWPHPSFYGDFLPSTRTVSQQGFTANWQLSSFATGANLTPVVADTNNIKDKAVSVKLFDPIDIYVLNDRAAKYGMLFIVLVFAAFYLFETFKKTNLHPIKYALVGLALAVFFLLLLSLSEKIGFVSAYIVAAVASIALIVLYMKPNFARKGSIILAAVLAFMFGAILLILKLENESLLVGSVLIFLTLAAVMLGTRSIDWAARD